MAKAADFLRAVVTRDYVPSALMMYHGWRSTVNLPVFSPYQVPWMLRDPRIRFGLWLIKGPILSRSRFFIDCDNPEVKEFLKNTLTRFWRRNASIALQAIEWGWSASEAIYRLRHGQIQFDRIKFVHPLDTRALTVEGEIVGAEIQRLTGAYAGKPPRLVKPKLLWHVHQPEVHPYYGLSRIQGSYLPWLEYWAAHGFRDSRRLFYYKYAYQGGGMYHPPGFTKLTDNDGNTVEVVSNRDLAREMLEKEANGAVFTLPNTQREGVREWERIPPMVNPPPTGLTEYGKDLKDEMFEGMGVPPEIARAEGTGAYAGRRVPMDAFLSTLKEITQSLLTDADTFIFRPLVEYNYGDVEYELVPFGLTYLTEQETGEPGQQGQLGPPDAQIPEPVAGSPPEGYNPKYAA